MIDARAFIQSVTQTRSRIEQLGAEYKGSYRFRDTIFVPVMHYDQLSDGYVRVRVYELNNWPGRKAVVLKKTAERVGQGKRDTISSRKEFDSEEEAFAFAQTMRDVRQGFAYSRDGWQYDLGACKLFIEMIEGYRPTVEVEAATVREAEGLLKKIGATEMVTESIPDIMRKILRVG